MVSFAAVGLITAFGCLPPKPGKAAEPIYGDTAGTVFDIITATDPSSFKCLEPVGQGSRQIWDKRVDGEPVVEAFLFLAHYDDGTNIEIAVNPEFGTREAAQAEAQRFADPLGRLPTVLRAGIRKFSIHDGDEGFHAGTGQIVVYAEKASQRESYNHLEESLFHEAVHASLDEEHRLAPGWLEAQKRDGRFLTTYGMQSPEREDLAETALFAFAILHHPERFPPVDTEDTLAAVPNRIEYIRGHLFPPDAPLVYQVASTQSCSG
ncbi:hypothetical protein ACW9UR_06570 [Halovulum sp. GXIMD14794]